MPAYRLSAPYERQPLRRRVSGLALAVAINVGLLLVLISLGIVATPSAQKTLRGIVVDLIPANRASSTSKSQKTEARQVKQEQQKPTAKPPKIVLPSKPTIAPPPQQPSTKPAPWLEMSKDEMAAGDISKMPVAGAGGGGDSEVVGKGPNGEAMYAAEWARRPTNAELDGYMPHNGREGFGLVACKTIPNDRVEDCVELDQTPGSRLASAVRQAAWQFHVRPPRKGGRPLIGSWVQIRIDYYISGGAGNQ